MGGRWPNNSYYWQREKTYLRELTAVNLRADASEEALDNKGILAGHLLEGQKAITTVPFFLVLGGTEGPVPFSEP